MKKVEFREIFNTSTGLMVIINETKVKVGDIIENQDGNYYQIVSINLTAKLLENKQVGLRVKLLPNEES